MKLKIAATAIVAVPALVGCGTDASVGRSFSGGATGTGGEYPWSGNGGGSGGVTVVGLGGAVGGGGANASGGVSAGGAPSGAGGTSASGGSIAITGGAGGAGGDAGNTTAGGGGADAAAGGHAGSGGSIGVIGPCDIYQSGNTPCVAAHSTVRALYGSFSGALYQVRRSSDNSTKDVSVLGTGGYADSSAQDAFCSGTACKISIIYDQSPNGNHLTKVPPGGWLNNGGLEADATAAKVSVGGHTVYGVYTTSNFDNNVGAVGYRNDATKGVATGDDPEAMRPRENNGARFMES